MGGFKGYLYVVVSGLVLLAAAIFVAAQWDTGNDKLQCGFSVYGSPDSRPTIYVILASAVGGVLVYWMCRLMVRGVRTLRKARRDQSRPPKERT